MSNPFGRIALTVAAATVSCIACHRPPPPTPAAAAPLRLEPCDLPGIAAGEARCGHLDVFENRATQEGRRISLRVAVLPATGASRHPDPVFVLVGGPGQSAVENVRGYARLLAALRPGRDLVFVDQRGTGASNPLRCDLYGATGFLGDFLPLDAVRACRDSLVRRADLAQYTTEAAMDDLDDVRAALGYARINLEAASYGTRAALVYLRRHGGRVRSAVLRSVSATDATQPLHFAADAQAALDSLLVDCARDPACRTAFPDLRTDFRTVLERLDRGGVTVRTAAAAGADSAAVRLERGPFAERVRLILYSPDVSRYLPAMVTRAAGGDFGPFAELSSEMVQAVSSQLSLGMYLTVTCAEDVRRIDESQAVQGATFLGDYRLRQQRAACALWPRATVAPDYTSPVRSGVPVLLVSSAIDPITPARWGERVAQGLSRSRHVVLRNAPHSPATPCVMQMVAQFIENPDPQALDARCAAEGTRPPFASVAELN
ncbi:MAG TPA: alpha/beta fold hydrolase [Longimicrobium sp.]|nr:alpha/beta fold hydrolase [Longimicrobium sp.]